MQPTNIYLCKTNKEKDKINRQDTELDTLGTNKIMYNLW